MKLHDEDWKKIDNEIQLYFWSTFYKPIVKILGTNIYFNSRSSVISAIRKGTLSYNDGVFSGKYNIAISRDLAKYAIFDKRSGTWKGNPPNDVKTAAIVANDTSEKLHNKIKGLLDDLGNKLEDVTSNIAFSIEKPFERMDKDLDIEFEKIGIIPEMTPAIKEKIINEYHDYQNLNIKEWTPLQIQHLRDAVEKSVVEGYRRPALIEMIQSEWNTSKNKAKFLARQETSIFMSKFELARAEDAGLSKYIWSTSHDKKVRPKNKYELKAGDDHRRLNGMVIAFNDPPIVNIKTGRRAHAGEDYGCRCAKKWVI